MKLNNYLTQLTTRRAGVVSGRSFGSSAVSLASPACAQCRVFLAATLFV